MNIITLAIVVSLVFLGTNLAIARSRTSGVALLCVVVAAGLLCYREHGSTREPFPLQFVSHRLAHEATSIGQVPVRHREDYSGRFGEGSSTLRHHMLRRLHRRKTSDFVTARGFGVGRVTISLELWNALNERVSRPSKQDLPYIPSDRLQDWPTPAAVEGQPLLDPWMNSRITTNWKQRAAVEGQFLLNPRRPEKGNLWILFSGRDGFFEPEPIVYVKDLNRVVGFTKMPEPKAEWQLVRLELVGLLKHEVPVAYVSQHLPQMDESKDALTRPLDDFERRALERLRSDEDLVIDDSPNRIRMVGSLRAGKDCLECHSVRRGELLGAFSYELLSPMRVKERRAESGA